MMTTETNFDLDIENCLRVLAAGGIILYPTDTIWGIGCDATNGDAVDRIYRLKKRPDEKAMIVLVADERDILKHVAAPDLAIFDFLATTSKPTTVIYDGAIGLAENLVGTDGSIGMRICNEIFCRTLIRRFRKPIVSTSANTSGEPAPRFFQEVSDDIRRQVDYTVSYRQGETKTAEPSAIVKWKEGKLTVVRP